MAIATLSSFRTDELATNLDILCFGNGDISSVTYRYEPEGKHVFASESWSAAEPTAQIAGHIV